MFRSAQRVARLKALPWAVLLRAGVVVGERWSSLSAKERARAIGLVKASHGRPGNLTSKEREELRKLVGKLDLKRAARELVPLMRPPKRRGRG